MNPINHSPNSSVAWDVEYPRQENQTAYSDHPWYDQESLEKLIRCSGPHLKFSTTNLPMAPTFTTAVSFRQVMQAHPQARSHFLLPDFNIGHPNRAARLQGPSHTAHRLQTDYRRGSGQVFGPQIVPAFFMLGALAGYKLSEQIGASFDHCVLGALLGGTAGATCSMILACTSL